MAVDLRHHDPRPAPDHLTIELRDCELIVSGTVRDVAGGTIAGARVRAAARSEFFGNVLTDEQGQYEICLLSGNAHVEVAADGYGTDFQHLRGRRAARVDFALSPEMVIAGRVVDDVGEPVGGAVVVAQTNGHDPGALTESAADGSFRLEGLRAGTYRVVARDDEHAADQIVTLNSADAAAEIVLALAPRATLAGRVLVGNRPTGATVVVHSVDQAKWKLGSAVAQADGRFAITGLPRTPVRLEVEKLELLAPDAIVDLAQVSEVELVCRRLATVSGRVLRAGEPVARAEVSLWHDVSWYQALSAEDGSFAIEGVAAATYELATRSLAQGAAMQTRPIEVGAEDVAGLLLELDLTASIAGTVVDTRGTPVVGANVDFSSFSSEDSSSAGASDVTAPDGSFLVTGLGPGTYHPDVMLSVDGWREYRSAVVQDRTPITVAERTSRITDVRLTVAAADLTISGRAVRRGEPVAGMEIIATMEVIANDFVQHAEARAHSGADGTFVFTGLRAGRYAIRGFQTEGAGVEVEAGATDVVLEVPATGQIEGALRGFRAPPRIAIRSRNQERHAEVADGRFTVPVIPVGTYHVIAISPSAEYAEARVTVDAEEVSRLTLIASGTGTVAGTVKDLWTGAPVHGISCMWAIGDSDSMQTVETDADGGFSLAVPAGPIRVDCTGGRISMMTARKVELDVAPGATARVVVEVIALPHDRRSGTVGVQVEEIPSGSYRIDALRGSAASSGLRVGDALLAVDVLPVAGLNHGVMYVLMIDRVGEAVRLTVERQGVQLTFDVVVEPPAM